MENFKKTIEANTTGPDSNGTWCPEWELKRTRWNTFSPPHVITSLSIRQEVNISSNHCPWCIGKTQNESELLLARGALLHLITWLWIYRTYIYICCVYSLQFLKNTKTKSITHMCHGCYPCISLWRFRQFVMRFLQLSYWCLTLDVYLPPLLGKSAGTLVTASRYKPQPIIWFKI